MLLSTIPSMSDDVPAASQYGALLLSKMLPVLSLNEICEVVQKEGDS